jgi:ATP-binding cassette subfamily B protein
VALASALYKLIDPSQTRKGVLVILLVAFGSLLDFFSLAFFLPMLMLIVKPAFISENSAINKLYLFLQFQSQETFIISFAGFVLLFVVLKSIIGMYIARVKARFAFTTGSELALSLLNRYLETHFTRFLHVDYSRELNRLSGHPIAFANNIILPVTTLISEVLVALLIVAGVGYYDFRVLFLFCSILVPILVLIRMRKKSLKAIDRSLKEQYPVLLKYTYQIVEGFPEIRSYAKEKYFKEKFRTANNEVIQTHIRDQTLQSGTTRFGEVIAGVIICSLVTYAIVTRLPYQETLVLLGLYAGATFRFIPSVSRILVSMHQIRSHQYLLEELNIPFQKNSTHPISHEEVSFNEKVEFRNVSFQYQDGEPLLKEITMTIKKGEMIALIGKSGAGKTTLLLILLRFLKETNGAILVDDKPLKNDQSWLKRIGYVPQRPYVLDGTVMENIAFGIPADLVNEKRVNDLIQYIELADWVAQLPAGMNTRLGEQGSKVSGGQRQRIALARALYADAEILLLDEVTNQVHHALEADILKLLGKLRSKGKTIVIITHKLSEPSLYDTVYRLENGVLFEAVPT